MKGNYIEFTEVKSFLKCLRQFQTSNIFFKDIYFRIVVLLRLILQLAFKVDRNQLIIHLDKLISDTEIADEDEDQDYKLTPLSQVEKNTLEELCNELIFNDLDENKNRSVKPLSKYNDDFEY
jgi:hypothetical protein